MSNLNEEFYDNLISGFIENNRNPSGDYIPRLLTNDKKEGIKVLSTIITELNSCDEFWFSVAFLTNSGLQSLINTFIDLKNKNVRGKILVSQYLNFTQPEALKRLLKFENIELRINTKDNFHSKGYLFKKGEYCNLIIGSSNLTANALSTNKELNLKVSARKDSYIITKAIDEFQNDFNNSEKVDQSFIAKYQLEYSNNLKLRTEFVDKELLLNPSQLKPNLMQIEALNNLKKLRELGKKKALLISATGTGKTYLSAFDAKEFNPKRLLFIVHRANIAETALKSFQRVFGFKKEMGLYTGYERNLDSDFIFSTVQTISKEDHLQKFQPEEFDYIIIDESHRAGADSYQKIVKYFNPKFLLGMTATPERTDGLDIFSLYDHNIAYEIRLQKALEIDILAPFHYFGVSDLIINGVEVEEKADFNLLTSDERAKRIIEYSQLYSSDNGIIRGLVFCSRVDEADELARKFNKMGYKSVSLTGSSSEAERSNTIDLLETEDSNSKIDYIFTRDIFNEGIDIPKVNQIIMLRPTQSAIVFVQQLGRGLRKADGKDYLTVIDFIGNYSNNFLIPIALFGDTTYNKDNLRKLIAGGSNQIPGTSTINFEKIAKEKIYAAIDQSNFSQKKDLIKDYELLKYKLGYIPRMMDFINYGSRDPFHFVTYDDSYFNFISKIEKSLSNKLSQAHLVILKLFSNEINNGKRVEEPELLKYLLVNDYIKINDFIQLIEGNYNYTPKLETIDSIINNLNFEFVNRRTSIPNIGVNDLFINENNQIILSDYFKNIIENDVFKTFLLDNIEYAINQFKSQFKHNNFKDGFILYQKYSRKDICRILNWSKNEESTMYGYSIKYDSCPIFVNYHKEENIASTTKFEDRFIDNTVFQWFSKPRRNLSSKDVTLIRNHNNKLRMLLFIKKSNGEGSDFYYMGDVKPIENSFKESTILDDHKKEVSVIKIKLKLETPVKEELYNYIIA